MKIAIIAGEPSGDMLAAWLINSLKKHTKEPIEFMGIGGVAMAKEGFSSAYNMDTLSVGGYGLDVLLAIPKIYILFKRVTQAIIEFNPDIFIGVDAPDFNFHIEKKLKQHGIRTMHYISPTIWAWRYERIYKIKKTTDFMLCIFPMEEAIYKQEGIKAKFVGNPLANQIEMDIDTSFYRNKLTLPTSGKVIFTILVGSRKAEINKLSPIFIEACNIIAQQVPNSVFLFPFAKDSAYNSFSNFISNHTSNFNYQIIKNMTQDAIKSADLVMAKSGTVTLEVALCKKPFIVSYKVAKLTEWIVKRKIKIKYVSQPNILLNEEVAPELLQDQATANNLANQMLSLYNDKNRQHYMIQKFYELHNLLKTTEDNNVGKTIIDFISK